MSITNASMRGWDRRLRAALNDYKLEWDKSGAPSDPNVPASRRPWWAAAPESTPPIPFTDRPYGGTPLLEVTRNSSVDGPLMVAIAHTGLGHALQHSGIQVYGWVNAGIKVSSNTVRRRQSADFIYLHAEHD